MRRRLPVVLITLSLGLGACSESPTEVPLPPFEAQVDGQLFAPSATDLSLYSNGTAMLISGQTTAGGVTRQVSVQLAAWHGVGTYVLAQPALGSLGFIADRNASGGAVGDWETTAAEVGQVVITAFDPAARRVAGTFSYRARGTGDRVIIVSDGRFDAAFVVDP